MKTTASFLLFLLLSSISVFAHDVVLTWNPSPDGTANPTAGYNVQRATTPGAEGSTNINSGAVAVGCTTSANCTYTDTSSAVVAGATLYYTVTFQVGTLQSAKSNEANATVPVAGASNLQAISN